MPLRNTQQYDAWYFVIYYKAVSTDGYYDQVCPSQMGKTRPWHPALKYPLKQLNPFFKDELCGRALNLQTQLSFKLCGCMKGSLFSYMRLAKGYTLNPFSGMAVVKMVGSLKQNSSHWVFAWNEDVCEPQKKTECWIELLEILLQWFMLTIVITGVSQLCCHKCLRNHAESMTTKYDHYEDNI